MSEEVENVGGSDDIRATMAEVYENPEPELEKVEVEDSAVEAEETPAEEINQEDELDAESVEAEKPAPIPAPVSWSDEAKKMFAKLPLETQEYIAKRESEASYAIQQRSEELNRVKQDINAIDSALSPIQHELRLNGLSNIDAVKEMTALYRQFKQNPVEYINLVAQSAGIDLQKLAAGQIDPMQIQSRQTAAEIAELKSRLASYENKVQAESNSVLQSEIERFASNPENKYFEQVREDMALLLANDKANDLIDAYEKACRLNPQIFEQIQKEKSLKQAKSHNEKAQAAKKAAGVRLKTRELSEPSKSSSGNIRDTMKEIFDELEGGGVAA